MCDLLKLCKRDSLGLLVYTLDPEYLKQVHRAINKAGDPKRVAAKWLAHCIEHRGLTETMHAYQVAKKFLVADSPTEVVQLLYSSQAVSDNNNDSRERSISEQLSDISHQLFRSRQ